MKVRLRSMYLWKIVQAKRLMREEKQKIYPAIVGFGILVISCGIIIVLKEKRAIENTVLV